MVLLYWDIWYNFIAPRNPPPHSQKDTSSTLYICFYIYINTRCISRRFDSFAWRSAPYTTWCQIRDSSLAFWFPPTIERRRYISSIVEDGVNHSSSFDWMLVWRCFHTLSFSWWPGFVTEEAGAHQHSSRWKPKNVIKYLVNILSKVKRASWRARCEFMPYWVSDCGYFKRPLTLTQIS